MMILTHNFDEPVNRINTDSFKWDYEGESGKYIPLGVADTDFKSPQPVIDMLHKKVDLGVYAYGYLPQHRFAKSICNWYYKRYGLNVNEEAIRYSQGLMTGALWMLLDAFTRPGDKILIQPPVYNTFNVVIKGAGRFIETNELKLVDGRYEMDFDDLERKTADPRVRILLVCNPHNPVGRVWTKEELLRVYEICKKNNVLIISDEIHGDIVYNGAKHTPFFSISEDAKNNIIVMSSPSKTFNLACFYSAYVVMNNKALRDQYDVVYSNYHFDYNYFGIEALITSYNECDYYVDQFNEYLWKNICIVKDFIKNTMPEVKVIEQESTYLMWLDFRAWNLTQFELMNFFKDSGVKVNDGMNYGKNGLGFVRVNIACQTAVLEKALSCISKAYKSKNIK
ncbi:MalY/PatB family protein [Abyssisolibacter fermentans]|uniref:MalY/PatB family protein n=1 Tax=Abyssisolibacter fermentans TaxID=1766203 RepID=UPI00082C6388|nr:MalY/PatB family protein [Abyssisolibacter fermentans]